MSLCINMEKKSPFERLQPTCVKLALRASVEDVDKLREIVNQIDKPSLITYQEYIIFPVRLILLKKPSEKLLIRAADFLTYFFDRSQLTVWDTFKNIFSPLINLLTNISNPEKVCVASEELKLSVCDCVTSLVKNACDNVVNEIYSLPYRLTLAQAFFVFVQLLKHEKSKVLRQKLLETIGTLAYNPEHQARRSSSIERCASKVLASFFPGLSSALMSIISGDNKQGQHVFRLALNVFSGLIVLVLDDKWFEGPSDDSKNSEWVEETSSVLKGMMLAMKILTSHHHWKVRLEFLKFIDAVLSHCKGTLEKCATVLLPVLFALSVDSHPQIALQSSNLVIKFSHTFQSGDSNSLLNLIEKDIHLSTSLLIKSKFSSNDAQILTTLRTLLGYVKVFDHSIDKLLLSSSNLERIFVSLINILELDVYSGCLVEDMSSLTDLPLCDTWPKKNFTFFKLEEILNTITDICHHVGRHGSGRVVTDFLFERQVSSEQCELQCLLLTSKVLEGVVPGEDTFAFVEDVISELFATSVQDSHPLSHHKILQLCLILEVIGKGSKVLKSNFRPLLIKILFHVLQQAGSSNGLISKYGKICLHTVAHYCSYPSVAILIQDNVDYLMNSLNINFHHIVAHPEMAVVLSVVLKEGSADILPHCKDSIHRLLGILDCGQHQAPTLLPVLGSILRSIKLCFLLQETNEQATGTDSGEDLKVAITSFKKRSEMVADETGNQEISCDEESDSVTKSEPPPPLYVSIAIEILKRCSHLQSSPDLHVKILCLEMMESCVSILGSYEAQLHPVVHELWPRFICRFHEESSVSLAAFRVLLAMGATCRDFIRRRVLQDVLGDLVSILKRNFSNSLKQNFRNYQWHNTCKLHWCVLSELGGLVSHLEVSGEEVALLAGACLPYLSELQARTFQEAAHKTIKALNTLDPDATWLYYNILYCQNRTLKAPHQNLYDFVFPNSSCNITEFKIDL